MKQYSFPTEKNFFVNYNHNDYPELHYHDYWEFVLITSGSFLHRINKTSHKITANTLLVIRPNDKHALLGSGAYINIGCRDSTFKSFIQTLYPDQLETLEKGLFYEFQISQSSASNIEAFTRATLFYKNSDDYMALLAALFLDFMRELIHTSFLPQTKKYMYSPTVSKIIEKIYNKDSFFLSVEDLIQDTNYAHSHVLRLFKQETGKTILQYHLDVKLSYAKNLLESSSLSISTITLELGFSNVGHFITLFKKQYGVTPAKYRKNWQAYYQSFKEI